MITQAGQTDSYLSDLIVLLLDPSNRHLAVPAPAQSVSKQYRIVSAGYCWCTRVCKQTLLNYAKRSCKHQSGYRYTMATTLLPSSSNQRIMLHFSSTTNTTCTVVQELTAHRAAEMMSQNYIACVLTSTSYCTLELVYTNTKIAN